MSGKLNSKSKVIRIAFGLIGAFSVMVALGNHLWGGRAPDVIYGDEINLPYGFLLLLLAIALHSGNQRVTMYAAIMTIVCGFEAIWMEALENPFSIGWFLVWLGLLACMVSVGRKQPIIVEGEIGHTA